FAHNWAGIKQQGLVRGAYHFFVASEDAVAQADHFCAVMGPLGAGDLPPTVDYENTYGMSATSIAQGLRKFLDRVKQKTGRTGMIYSDPSHWSGVADHSAFAQEELWVAHWDVTKPSVSTPWHDWMF